MTEHPELSLSAYLDDALPPDERAAVRAHVDGCARCRGQVDGLRATSRLIAALPVLVPTRSLVPRTARGPVWLRPVRLLGSIGTGTFLFLFLASYVLNSGSSLGGGTTTSERLAAKGNFGAAASAIAAENAQKATTTASQPAAGVPATQATGTTSVADSAARNTSSSASPAAQLAAATGAATSLDRYDRGPGRDYGPPTGVFLALALLCAIAALVAHRRLRRA
jgi:anti-sigma factor RsiW